MSISSGDVELVALRDNDKETNVATCALDKVISEDDVACDSGTLHVIVQGTANKPAIITYHDIGLNSHANFHAFFNYSEMQQLLKHFCVYHVNAPGQENKCLKFPDNYVYPNMDTLADMLMGVMKYYRLKTFIGLGAGAGANILTRFAIKHPKVVNALCLVNATSTVCSWSEWGYQKWNIWSLKSGNANVGEGVVDYLTWHHFGSDPPEHSNDVIQLYRNYFEHSIQPFNLALYIESYVKRTDIGLVKCAAAGDNSSQNVRCPVLLLTSTISPQASDVEHMFSRINPQYANILKLHDCSGAVLEEEPGKVSEALRLFLQGEGYIPCIKQSKPAYSRSSSQEEQHKATEQVFHVGM